METLIRRRALRLLIWVCAVSLCPTKRKPGLYGLRYEDIKSIKIYQLFYHGVLRQRFRVSPDNAPSAMKSRPNLERIKSSQQTLCRSFHKKRVCNAYWCLIWHSVSVSTMSTSGSDNKPNTCILESSEVRLRLFRFGLVVYLSWGDQDCSRIGSWVMMAATTKQTIVWWLYVYRLHIYVQ